MQTRIRFVAPLVGVVQLLGTATPGLVLADQPAQDCLAPEAECTLREVADQAVVGIGAAAQPQLIDSDPAYGPALASDFNSVTAENAMKWSSIQPSEGVWNFADADALVAFAESNEMAVRGHTLIWGRMQVPAYVENADTPERLRELMRAHISTVVGRYAGRISVWDVVNEPMQLSGGDLEDYVFTRLLGREYISLAFELAHEFDPDAKLFLNEVSIEMVGPKWEGFYDLVVDLLDEGVPIHGVGFQAHLIFGAPPLDEFRAHLQAIADLGLEVELTEMDVPISRGLPGRRQRQREIYHDVMSTCLEISACRRITFWGFTDRYTWIDSFFGPGRIPLPLDDDYARKPAWFGARDALLEKALAVPEPTAFAHIAAVTAIAWLARRQGTRSS